VVDHQTVDRRHTHISTAKHDSSVDPAILLGPSCAGLAKAGNMTRHEKVDTAYTTLCFDERHRCAAGCEGGRRGPLCLVQGEEGEAQELERQL